MKSNKYNGINNRYKGQPNTNHAAGPRKRLEKWSSNKTINGNASGEKKSLEEKPLDRQVNSEETSGDVLNLFQNVCTNLSKSNFDSVVVAAIVHLNAGLKIYGAELETLHKAELDELIGELRKASKESELDLVARLQMVEIIEMRMYKWKPNETVSNYWKEKVNNVENSTAREALDYVNNAATFDLKIALSKSLASTSKGLNPYAPDFTPTLTARYLAKASDSLANMLHLEPNSSTAISDEHKSSLYKLSPKLADKRRQRIAKIHPPSPSGDSKASGDGTFAKVGQEYQATINFGQDSIKIVGRNQDLVRRTKLEIENCFAKLAIQEPNLGLVNNKASIIAGEIVSNTVDSCMPKSPTLSPTKKKNSLKRSPKKHVSISDELQIFDGNTVTGKNKAKRHNYDRKTLLKCSDSPFSKIVPIAWSNDWQEATNLKHLIREAFVLQNMIQGSRAATGQRPEQIPPVPDYNADPIFPGFVRSMVEESSSTETSPRYNNYVSKNSHRQSTLRIKPQGPVKTWDEVKDLWVEVGPGSNM